MYEVLLKTGDICPVCQNCRLVQIASGIYQCPRCMKAVADPNMLEAFAATPAAPPPHKPPVVPPHVAEELKEAKPSKAHTHPPTKHKK